MRYSKIQDKVWHSLTFRQLDESTKLLWFYLLTCPHRNMLGLYVLKPGYAIGDLNGNWDETKFYRCISNLCQCQTSNNTQGLINYDADCNVLLICNYLEHNPLENPNQVIAAIKKARGIPPTPLTAQYITILERLGKPLHKPLLEQLKRLGEGLPKGLPKPDNRYPVTDIKSRLLNSGLVTTNARTRARRFLERLQSTFNFKKKRGG